MIETRGIAARLRRGIGVLLPVLFLSFCASAQTDNTQVSGFVKDASGAVVPEATVTARSEATGAERTVKTNSEGYYVITPLAPGLYTITAQQAGFKKFELTHRKLDPSAPANADIVLEIGTQSEAVTVEAQATNLDTGSAAITRLIERKTIEMTELNGRNPVMLALLKTGVTNASFALPDFIPSMTTGQFNINGSRSQSNAIMFDGAVGIRTRSNDTWSIGAADVGQTQEVQILTANYNAEYGRAAGGQIRVVSKTGTRRLHGEAYEYVRNPAFNANDWSRNANPQPGDCNTNPGLSQCRPGPFRFNQFGWNLNGPVPKTRDKVFWSYSQEWMRLRSPQNATGKVPTDRMRTGDFGEFLVPSQFGAARILKDPLTCDSNGANCANFPGNVIPENRLSANGKALLNAYPAATASPRVNSLIFGAVDYTKDMRVTLTSEGVEQLYARYHTAVAARAAGCVAIDCPYVAFQDTAGYEKSTREGRQMGYEGRMLIHPSQIEPSHVIYTPSATDVEWAEGVKKVFEEEGIAKGAAAVTYKGKMVDTPVYENAMTILRTIKEIQAADAKKQK